MKEGAKSGKRKSLVRDLFGDGIKFKDLTREQKNFYQNCINKTLPDSVKEARRKQQAAWRDKNKEHFNEYQRNYARKRRQENKLAKR